MRALHAAQFANLTTSQRADDGLVLTDAFIAAAVRCAPPHNKPTAEEISACQSHLAAEINALPHLRAVVALGRIAFDAYLQLLRVTGVAPHPRPGFAHGSRATLPNGLTLIGSYHPSRQNTNTRRLTPEMLASVFLTAQRIVR